MLKIPTVTRNHEGKYTCSVKNHFLNTPPVLEHTIVIGEPIQPSVACSMKNGTEVEMRLTYDLLLL